MDTIAIDKRLPQVSFETQLRDINLLLAQFGSSSFCPELINIDDQIIELWNSAKSDQEKMACIDLSALVPIDIFRNMLLEAFAMEAYQKQNYSLAFHGFLRGAQAGNDDLKNNLAYMIRRKEYELPGTNAAKIALQLLKPGLKEKKSFSIVNTAMVFCLIFGSDDDWKTADSLFDYLSSEIESISTWWSALDVGDLEGQLVHFFLLRHRLIAQSTFGSIRKIRERLAKELSGFPEWLSDEILFKSLDEVFTKKSDVDFNMHLDGYLSKLPKKRDSVNEILSAISKYDSSQLYTKLFTDFKGLLTADEFEHLTADYKMKFFMPLPGESE